MQGISRTNGAASESGRMWIDMKHPAVQLLGRKPQLTLFQFITLTALIITVSFYFFLISCSYSQTDSQLSPADGAMH